MQLALPCSCCSATPAPQPWRVRHRQQQRQRPPPAAASPALTMRAPPCAPSPTPAGPEQYTLRRQGRTPQRRHAGPAAGCTGSAPDQPCRAPAGAVSALPACQLSIPSSTCRPPLVGTHRKVMQRHQPRLLALSIAALGQNVVQAGLQPLPTLTLRPAQQQQVSTQGRVLLSCSLLHPPPGCVARGCWSTQRSSVPAGRGGWRHTVAGCRGSQRTQEAPARQQAPGGRRWCSSIDGMGQALAVGHGWLHFAAHCWQPPRQPNRQRAAAAACVPRRTPALTSSATKAARPAVRGSHVCRQPSSTLSSSSPSSPSTSSSSRGFVDCFCSSLAGRFCSSSGTSG